MVVTKMFQATSRLFQGFNVSMFKSFRVSEFQCFKAETAKCETAPKVRETL
jgi:hypothetical protein